MTTYSISKLNKTKRGANRASYDKETVHDILDSAFLCHIGYIYDNKPIIIPTAYGREDEKIYLHGAIANRMMNAILEAGEASLTVTHLDGLVLARSAFHHSANYRSVVVFGKVKFIEKNAEKLHALKVIMDQMMPGRWEECRLPNEKELKATLVLAIEIETASAKIRQGDPVDDKEDYSLPHWAGVLPISQQNGEPIADSLLNKDVSLPPSLS